jgi:hypothetical protein
MRVLNRLRHCINEAFTGEATNAAWLTAPEDKIAKREDP